MRRLPGRTAIVALLVVAGCGGGEPERSPAADAERAFLSGMVPHHQGAVDMAQVAATEARTPFVRRLAAAIESSQTAEIARMERIHQRLLGSPLRPDMGAHMALGLSAEEAGMDHMGGAATMRGRQPFDRAFVDEMVPHHEGAVRMAKAIEGRTGDAELRALAAGIVDSQQQEIAAMRAFREREYGEPAPAARPGEHHR